MASEMSVALGNLHSLLLQLSVAEANLADGPRAIGVAEKQVTQVEQRIEQQKQTIKANRKTADELNLKLKSKEADLAKLAGQLNTASSNKEYEIFKGQIEAGKATRSEMEETAFAAMEEIDTAQAQLRSLEVDLQNRKNSLKTAKSDYDTRRPELEAAITTLHSQIADAEKVIPGEGKANYLRLRKAHGAGALAVMEDDFCQACDTRVTNQDMVRIRMSEFMSCRGCGRYLYFKE